MNRRYAIAWLTLGLAALGLEVAALVDDGAGDTLSELLWIGLASHPLVWFAGLGAFAWLGAHLFRRTWRRP